MPVNHTKLNEDDVRDLLRRRGYRFHLEHGSALRLTKADMRDGAVFKYNGKRRRIPLVPIGKKMLDEILTYARNDAEAAEQIEKISLGVQDAPEWAHIGASQPADNAMSSDVMAKLIENRVAAAVAHETQRANTQVAALQEQLEAAQKQIQALAAQPKRGRPRKRGKKSDNDEPDLNAEEQKALDAIMNTAQADLSE